MFAESSGEFSSRDPGALDAEALDAEALDAEAMSAYNVTSRRRGGEART
jgi:hypothetical protein